MNNLQKVLICVDAGGTKTKINVYDLEGKVLKTTMLGVGSPAVTKDLEFLELDKALENLQKEISAYYQIINITLGISGLGVVPKVDKLVTKFTNKYQCTVVIENDATIAMYSIVAKQAEDILENRCPDGILVLGGTGSAICGIKDGKLELVGGWGQIIGERGSAYALVHQACLRIIKETEQHKELSYFDQQLLQEMGFKDAYDFKPMYYLKSKGEIAKYAKFIKDLAKCGNSTAIRIIQNEAIAICKGVITLIDTQKFENGVILGFKGGFFEDNEIIINSIKEIFEYHKYSFNYLLDDTDPIIGAFLLAKATYLKEIS